MNKSFVTRCTLALSILLATAHVSFAIKTFMLKSSMAKKIVSVRSVSNGGHMGKGLTVRLSNNTSQEIRIQVDPALIFVADQPGYQHLVAVGEETIVLKPAEEGCLELQTFCGKASAHSPLANIKYKYWKQGDPGLVQASRYIKAHALFNSIGQHAVWMFTDNHSLGNIYSPYDKGSEGRNFVAYLSQITGRKIPEYYTYHHISERGQVFDPSVSKVFVDLNWNKEYRRTHQVLVFNQRGELYKVIEGGEVIDSKGNHNVKVVFDPKKDPPGKYTVQLKDSENEVLLQKIAVVGAV
ncbi:MAG: hypothetical protein EOP49_34550 [Sphingobacteriales bacterium]|nr:MAG: hypothetical protein EOP49_34550 [Sphingobacteriales bacterium]